MAEYVSCLPESGADEGRRRLARFCRRWFRLAGFVGVILGALGDWVKVMALHPGGSRMQAKAEWLSRWSRRALSRLDIHVRCTGAPPRRGILVANHLGYLDILVLSATYPFVFLAKFEVRSWPLFGWLARMGGTLFVRRDVRSDVTRVNAELAAVVEAGLVVVIFPEGTSTDGHRVLPFHSSLLAPPATHGWPVTPAGIGYTMADGSVEDEVCYWRDMVFLPHFLNLLKKTRIDARVLFGPAITAGPDRKRLAREMHDAVVALAAERT